MEKGSKIFVAGHNGMVGSAIVRNLISKEYKNLILLNREKLNLLNQQDVEFFFKEYSPDYVFVAAAKVGGILANNTFRADFIYQNLTIQNNIINSAFLSGVEKLLFLGSSCIYPKNSQNPIKETDLLSGKLEITNEPYAIAKIAGIKMCESYYKQHKANFFSIMPTNLYGIKDNFNLKTSHVLPALIRKIHEAKINKHKSFEVWGTGLPKREFLYVDDLADACVFLMNNYNASDIYSLNISHLNIGSGEEVSILELSNLIKETIRYRGNIVFNNSYPDGMMRKLIDNTNIKKMGWTSKTSLKEGIQITYDWFKNNK